MIKFNLNNYVLVQITQYGWEYLKKNFEPDFIKHLICSKAVEYEGEIWYKLQAHNIPDWFGNAVWATYPAPIGANILIPEPLEVQK